MRINILSGEQEADPRGRGRALRHSRGGRGAGRSRRRLARAGAAGGRAHRPGGDLAGGRDPPRRPGRRRSDQGAQHRQRGAGGDALHRRGGGAGSVSVGRRVPGPGAHPYRPDRLSAEHGASLHDRPGGGARPGRGGERGRAQADRAHARRAAPAHRGSALCRADPAPPAAGLRREPRGVQRQRAARGLVRPADAGGHPRRGPAAGRRARSDARHSAGSETAAGLDHLDRAALSRRDRGAAAPARSRLLALRHRQPRAPGISRRAGVSAGVAPAGHGGGPSRPRVSRP